MSRRAGVLDLAVLGLLHDGPLHGYELRKRLNAVLGSFHAISYGSLYPCLKALVDRGLIVEDLPESPAPTSSRPLPPLTGRRARIAYRLTADGKEHFQSLLSDTGPDSWEDERFGVHVAFFGRTDAEVRLRILEGRRSRLEERLAILRGNIARGRERMDGYTIALQNHGLDSVEREVRWLGELIDAERGDRSTTRTDPAVGDNQTSSSVTTERNLTTVTTDTASGTGHRPSV